MVNFLKLKNEHLLLWHTFGLHPDVFHYKEVTQQSHWHREGEIVEPGKDINDVDTQETSYGSYIVRQRCDKVRGNVIGQD